MREPDGYTICIIPESVFLYNPYMFKTMPFDPGKDLTPVSHLFDILQVIVVNASLKVKTLDELADLSKKEKGTLSYIAPAIGQDIVFETLIKETGADLVRVPFRGGGQAVAALMTGTTPIASLGLGNVIGHIRSGKMVAIAIHGTSARRCFRMCRRCARSVTRATSPTAPSACGHRPARRRTSSPDCNGKSVTSPWRRSFARSG